MVLNSYEILEYFGLRPAAGCAILRVRKGKAKDTAYPLNNNY